MVNTCLCLLVCELEERIKRAGDTLMTLKDDL